MQLTDKIHLLRFDEADTNLYLVVDNGEAALIDAHVGPEADRILAAIQEIVNLSQLKMVILTHGHPDHVGACPKIKERTSARTAAHFSDKCFIEDPWSIFSVLYHYATPTEEQYADFIEMVGGCGSKVDIMLYDRDILRVGSTELEIIHTPGHSLGSICLYEKESKSIITGDVTTPVEWFPEWLGFIVDARYHMESLHRLSNERIDLFLPGHGPIREKLDSKKDILKHIERFEKIESEMIQIISAEDGLTLPKVRNRLVERFQLDRDEEELGFGIHAEWHTVYAFLQKLCFEGKLAHSTEQEWKVIDIDDYSNAL